MDLHSSFIFFHISTDFQGMCKMHMQKIISVKDGKYFRSYFDQISVCNSYQHLYKESLMQKNDLSKSNSEMN